MAKKNKKKGASSLGSDGSIVASNRKARHDFQILETHEAGIALVFVVLGAAMMGLLTDFTREIMAQVAGLSA